MKKLFINTDGGSRGNPGKAAAGFIVRDGKGDILLSDGSFIGVATNNDAEYAAVKLAFGKVKNDFRQDLPVRIEVRADSMLVVNQLAGKFKIKNPRLLQVIQEIKSMEDQIGEVTYLYIPRAQNWEADKIVNQILDKVSL